MPSSTKKQSRFMTANCKSAGFRRKTGMDKDVACKFHGADKGKFHENGELNRIRELAGLEEQFIQGERVYHMEQKRIGTVVGYEGNEIAVEFDDEPGEAYYVDNAVLKLIKDENVIKERMTTEYKDVSRKEFQRLVRASNLVSRTEVKSGEPITYWHLAGDQTSVQAYSTGRQEREMYYVKEDGADPYGGSMISPHSSDPNERAVENAYQYAVEILDNFFEEKRSKAYIEDILDTSINPEEVAGMKGEFISDASGHVANKLEDWNIAFLGDEVIKELVISRLSEYGIFEDVEMDEKKLEERKLVHAIKTEDGETPDTRSSDIGRMMRLAGLTKRLDADKKEGKVDFDGIFTGVARGDIDVNEETEFEFLRTLEETNDKKVDEGKKRDVDGDGDIDSDDWKAAKDKAIKKAIKKESVDVDESGMSKAITKSEKAKQRALKKARSLRKRGISDAQIKKDVDISDKELASVDESEYFKKGSLSRYMVEMILDEMNKGLKAEEIDETLSFDSDHVAYVVEFVKNKNELDELAPATGKKYKGLGDKKDGKKDKKTDEAIQDNSLDRMRKLSGMTEKKDKWIQGAVDPEHEGYCTPMTKDTCTPKRKALARRFKSGDLS